MNGPGWWDLNTSPMSELWSPLDPQYSPGLETYPSAVHIEDIKVTI